MSEQEQELKAWIDRATYTQLLAKWRYASAGDPFFSGEVGQYYKQVMARRRQEIGQDAAVRASKAVGWHVER